MRPIILDKMDELKQYTEHAIETIADFGTVKISSVGFQFTIPAGQLTGQIPVDSFDRTTDTLIVYVNTRAAGPEVTWSQTPGQRAVLNIGVTYPRDALITGTVLKNVVRLPEDRRISGVNLETGSTPFDRLAPETNVLPGSVLRDMSVPFNKLSYNFRNTTYASYDENGFARRIIERDENGNKLVEINYSDRFGNDYMKKEVKVYYPGDLEPHTIKTSARTFDGNGFLLTETWT